MKTLRKVFSVVLLVCLVVFTAFYCIQPEKTCCLCNSFRFHAPCLIDLETGELTELELYFPHLTQVAELADPQPEMGNLSLVRLGNATGTRDTGSKIANIQLPISEKTTNPALCKSCRKQLGWFASGRYVLGDLYSSETKKLIPLKNNLQLVLRCYEITAYQNKTTLHITVQGTRDSLLCIE